MLVHRGEISIYYTYLEIVGEAVCFLVRLTPFEASPYRIYKRNSGIWCYVVNLNENGEEIPAYQLSIGCEIAAMDITQGLDDYEKKRETLSRFLFERASVELALEVPEACHDDTPLPLPNFPIALTPGSVADRRF